MLDELLLWLISTCGNFFGGLGLGSTTRQIILNRPREALFGQPLPNDSTAFSQKDVQVLDAKVNRFLLCNTGRVLTELDSSQAVTAES